MGTNKGKLKKVKRQHNDSQENRRKQVLKAARQKAEEIEDRAKLAHPATAKELHELQQHFAKNR